MLPFPLLRSVMRCSPEELETELSSNLFALRRELEPEGVDKDIVNFVGDIYDRTLTVPAFALVHQHFKALEDKGDGRGLPGQMRLDAMNTNDPEFLPVTTFRVALDDYREGITRETLSKMIVEAASILTDGVDRQVREKGKPPRKVRLHGADDSLQYVQQTITTLNRRIRRGSIEGAFRNEGDALLADYEKWKNDPASRIGVLSGIERIDTVHRGLKKGELALVLGFVSHMKTSFCLNWAYKAAMWYGHNVAIVSLETQADILRNLLYVMHSTHKRFQSEDEASLGGIDYDKLTTGSMSAEEEKQFRTVVTDFSSNSEYGEIFYKEPEGSITIDEIKQWAEGLNRAKPIDLIVIDYLGLVDAAPGQYSVQEYANLNLVIRQAKKNLAMSFANGRGVGVLSPFQANREGLKEAEKAGGRYKLTALAGAPEAEKSADLVYYTYLDDNLRNARELAAGNLKNRNGKVINDQMKLFANAATRTINDFDLADPLQQVVDMEAGI